MTYISVFLNYMNGIIKNIQYITSILFFSFNITLKIVDARFLTLFNRGTGHLFSLLYSIPLYKYTQPILQFTVILVVFHFTT